MPRKRNDAVLEGNCPVPMLSRITLEELRRVMSEMDEALKGCTKNLKREKQRGASLEQDSWQPRLAMEADGPADTKTRKRTEAATKKVVQTKHRDSCTTQRVQDGPKTSTCFGVKAEPPALPCRDDVLVEISAAAPKSYIPPLEMRSPTTAGGLLPTGEASIVTRTTFDHSTLWFYLTNRK